MADSSKGQALVEYVMVLVIFSVAALAAWNLWNPAVPHSPISNIYTRFSNRRAGIRGMFP